jgi:hypothetical protein
MNPRSSDLAKHCPGIYRLLRNRGGGNAGPGTDERLLISELESDFFPKYWLESRHDWAERYLETWRVGAGMRKPFSGFHPGIYRDHHPELRGDPTMAFLKEGKPPGPWLNDVTHEGKPGLRQKFNVPRGNERQLAIRSALHLHMHYPERAGNLFRALNAARLKPDLFISVTSQDGKKQVNELLDQYGRATREIALFPNRGRDLAPFFTGFRDLLSDYEIVGHFHTKQSRHVPSGYAKKWASFLQANLIGERGEMVDSILSRFAEDPTIGIVYPDDPIIVGWLENYRIGKGLLERTGLPVPDEKHFFNFPVGSMFWARTAALKPLFELGLGWDYPPEPISQDGTILHAMERLLGVIPGLCGYRTLVTHVSGAGR